MCKKSFYIINFGNSLILLFLLPVFLLQAQNIRFNKLTVKDGLSQNAVTCIFQDSRGFMWFGTQDGLNKYDGYNFKVFKNNPDDTTSISDNFVFSIFEDADENFYVQTISGKLHLYNPLEESFSVIGEESVDLHNSRYSTVLSFYYDKDSIEWRGGASRGTGLTRIDKKTGDEKVYKHEPGNVNSISDDKVYSVMRDKDGFVWIATTSGLDRLDESTGTFKHYSHSPADPNSISDNFVWPLLQDSRGNIWAGTVNGGLNKYDPGTESFTRYQNDPASQSSISDDFIFSIYESRSGIIWIGTSTGGINYFHRSSLAFEHFTSQPDNPNSLDVNDIRSIIVDSDGIYWAGTIKGLERFDYSANSFTHFKHEPGNPSSLIDNPLQAMHEDSGGNLWLGTFNGGLVKFNKKNQSFKLYTNDKNDISSISDNRIYSIYEDSEGSLWIGTYSGGLNLFDKNTGSFTHYMHDENDSTSISSNGVWSIAEDSEGNLWLGTYGGGINVFNKSRGTFKSYEPDEEEENTISNGQVIKVFLDSRGIVWAGTMGGLTRFDKDSGVFKTYTEQNGLCNNVIFGIVEDDNGNLWVSTYNGLSRFNPESEVFSNYYYHDGLQSNEFNQNAYAKDPRNGKLLFGGPGGLNIFHPDSIKGNQFVPPIEFTDYLRYNSDDTEGRAVVEKGISRRNQITLTYKDNIVSFGFSALSYYNNFMNQYRYKLEGFNDNWIQLGSSRNVTFTNLSPGSYKLKITGSNNNGVWNEKGAELLIDVTPPWWRSDIAYACYVIIAASLLFGIRRFEINRREAKAQLRENELLIAASESEKRALKAENDRKTQELEDARNMQLSMLPKEVPDIEGLDIAVFMRTATEVGGDYYDFIIDENGTLNIAFGDATGHGIQAGTMVTLIKGFFASYGSNSNIKSFFERSTKTIKDIKLGRILMAFTFMKINGKSMHFSSAGMPPVYYFLKSSRSVEELMVKGMPLGAMSKLMFYEDVEKKLESGDTLLLFSDGLPEQMNPEGEMYDYPRFIEKFRELAEGSSQEIVDNLLETIDTWRDGAVQEDDISLMVIKVA